MSKEKVTIEKKIAAPVELVWKALTSAPEMKNWYFAMEKFIPEPGFSFRMFGEKNGKFFPIRCCIIQAEQNKLLTYSWSYEEYPAETLLRIELEEDGKKTLVRLTHSGLDQFPKEMEHLDSKHHKESWNTIIGKNLKTYAEMKAKAEA
jgi:uncharacterized protein YndB with AHSA1/START domain